VSYRDAPFSMISCFENNSNEEIDNRMDECANMSLMDTKFITLIMVGKKAWRDLLQFLG
jgi:hypothetical protein